jgi:hypothetical protein
MKVGDLIRDTKNGKIGVLVGTHSTGYQRVRFVDSPDRVWRVHLHHLELV